MNKIEQVARAIYEATEPKNVWEIRSDEFKRDYLDYARAAIEAMREPTEAMCSAAEDSGSLEAGSSPFGAWQAMIDAALKE